MASDKELLRETTAGGPPIKGHQPVPEYNMRIVPSIMGFQPMNTNIPQAPDVGITKSMNRLSNKLDDLIFKFKTEQDEARVTEAMTDLRRYATDLEAGENGWRTKLEKAALDPDLEGRSLVERTDIDLRRHGEALKENLSDSQRKLFDKHAANVYQSTYAGVSQHMMQQGQEYSKNVSRSAIEEEINIGSVYGYKPDMLKQSEDRINQHVDKLQSLMGWGSEETSSFRRKNISALYTNSITNLLIAKDRRQRNPALALGVLKANSGKMTTQDVQRLRRMIDASMGGAVLQSAAVSDREARRKINTNGLNGNGTSQFTGVPKNVNGTHFVFFETLEEDDREKVAQAQGR